MQRHCPPLESPQMSANPDQFIPANSIKIERNEGKPAPMKRRLKREGGAIEGTPIVKKKKKNAKGVKFGGKKPHQVARRNERERRRVQQVNTGYEMLANTLANAVTDGDTKKLTKAETLKAAILYIHHLEQILNKPMTAGADENAPSPMEMKPPIWCLSTSSASSTSLSSSSSSSSSPSAMPASASSNAFVPPPPTFMPNQNVMANQNATATTNPNSPQFGHFNNGQCASSFSSHNHNQPSFHQQMAFCEDDFLPSLPSLQFQW